MRFPHRARSRRPNPEPASLIAPVVSESARLLRIDPKCFPRSMAFCLGGRSAPFFAPDRFSAAHARKPSQPFKSRRALSRLKSRVFRSVRENASGEGRVVRAARARLYTRGRARRTNVRATTFLSRHASSAFLADMSADEPFAPESSRRRRDPAEALGVDERGRVRRARVPGGRRGGLRRRAVAQRAGRDVLPLRLRGGAAVRVRAAPASRRGRFARARTVVASETNGFSDTLSPRDDATL